MIFEVNQIKSNYEIKFEYKHQGETIRYGKNNRFSKSLSNELSDINDTILFKSHTQLYDRVKTQIPFFWIFTKGKSKIVYVSNVEGNESVISHIRKKQNLSYDIIEKDLYKIKIYEVNHDTTQYLSIYTEDKQIAMITKSYKVDNNLDKYKLYLLDEHKRLQDLLFFYILYFDNYNHSDRGQIVYGKKEYEKHWDFSENGKYLDTEWLKKNFGVEDKIDFLYSETKVNTYKYIFNILIFLIISVSLYLKYLR